jgi:hypothetical protein
MLNGALHLKDKQGALADAANQEQVNHQAKANRILFPSQTGARKNRGAVRCRERLGGLLKYYEREAA